MVLFQDVTKDYGNGRGVFDLNFELEKGEIYGFLGKNGAGKTTSIKLIMGLLRPDKGSVFFDNKNLRDFDNLYSAKKHIGYLPDASYLLENLSGRENLEYISLLKTGKSNAYMELKEEMEMFEIDSVLDDVLSSYSTGMTKKLHLIASLIGNPQFILWDEPHSGLDVLSNLTMKKILKNRINSEKTVLFSSHILEMTEDVCDNVIIINQGRICNIWNKTLGKLSDFYMEVIRNER